ncbi:hypothetical protein [Longimicrobium sp.]|uniref:DUF3108 domain-containing protein n=1 Tax=Longimicrobium sp. TaxID=2029185 RepID=UPI003B3B38A8
MRMHSLAVALLLACACAPSAGAQTAVLRPGDAVVRAETVGGGVQEFDLVEEDGSWEPVGRMVIRTRMVPVDGTPVIVRTEAIWMDDQLVQVDSFTLDRRTLAPLALLSSSIETGVQLDFSPRHVRKVDNGDWGADTCDVALPEPVFLGGTTDLLLGSLPLATGYTAKLAVFDAQDGIDTISVEVEAMEDVALPEGGGVSAWRVAVTEGWLVSTYWMDRESRTLVQFESADGSFRIVRSRGSRSRARPTR